MKVSVNNKMTTQYQRIGSLLLLVLVTVMTSACDSPEVLATIDGEDITKPEFEAFLKFKRIKADDSGRLQSVTDSYLEREALAIAIGKTDVLDKALIDAELHEFQKEMLINRYFENFLKDKVSDEAIRNYYVANEKTYQERQVNVAHILLRTNRNMGETEKKAKLTTAQEAYSKIKTGKEFEDIAKKYSEDTHSGKKGGKLGWIKEGAIHKSFTEKVFAMKPGDVSEPFETPFGYHIVKLIEGPKVVTRPFDAVKGDIRYKLRNQAKEAELERLKKMAEIKKS